MVSFTLAQADRGEALLGRPAVNAMTRLTGQRLVSGVAGKTSQSTSYGITSTRGGCRGRQSVEPIVKRRLTF